MQAFANSSYSRSS